jgi:hypothetical protein
METPVGFPTKIDHYHVFLSSRLAKKKGLRNYANKGIETDGLKQYNLFFHPFDRQFRME